MNQVITVNFFLKVNKNWIWNAVRILIFHCTNWWSIMVFSTLRYANTLFVRFINDNPVICKIICFVFNTCWGTVSVWKIKMWELMVLLKIIPYNFILLMCMPYCTSSLASLCMYLTVRFKRTQIVKSYNANINLRMGKRC